MTALKTRPDNLDFIFGVSNIEQYFIPSLVLVQSILENNLWANQIQISIFYENWSPEQKKAYKKLIDNFNKSQGKNFAILNLFDVTKLEFENESFYKGFNNIFRIEGLKFFHPISNWVFSIEANELNIRSLEPLISKLNQDFSDCYVVGEFKDPRNVMNFLDGSHFLVLDGPIFILNSKFIHRKNGILEKFNKINQQIKNLYPKLYDKILYFSWLEYTLPLALKNVSTGSLNLYVHSPTSLDKVSNSIYFLKWGGIAFSPWRQQFPDNSLKKLWLEYASKNRMSKDFQIPFPDKYKDKRSPLKKKYDQIFSKITGILRQMYFVLLRRVAKISPKTFRKLFVIWVKHT